MMIPIILNVKESAYDKVIYFLSHLKDDVAIINRPKIVQKDSTDRVKQIKILERLATLDRLVTQSSNKVQVTREIAINTDGMSDDISRH